MSNKLKSVVATCLAGSVPSWSKLKRRFGRFRRCVATKLCGFTSVGKEAHACSRVALKYAFYHKGVNCLAPVCLDVGMGQVLKARKTPHLRSGFISRSACGCSSSTTTALVFGRVPLAVAHQQKYRAPEPIYALLWAED